VTTEIEFLSNGTLVEKTDGGSPRTMLANVSEAKDPADPAKTVPIFRYENFTIPEANPWPIGAGELGAERTALTILVRVAFKASPRSEPVADAGAATEIENSATLRLTPPTYREGDKAKPCE
jgi:hypothetical protein